jgi:hypothetical protein
LNSPTEGFKALYLVWSKTIDMRNKTIKILTFELEKCYMTTPTVL